MKGLVSVKRDQREMDSLARVEQLDAALCEVISKFPEVTFGELFCSLARITSWWAHRMRGDEWRRRRKGKR